MRILSSTVFNVFFTLIQFMVLSSAGNDDCPTKLAKYILGSVGYMVEGKMVEGKAVFDGPDALIKPTQANRNDIVVCALQQSTTDKDFVDPILKKTALIIAAENGYDSIVKSLLSADVNVNVQDGSGNTSLILATIKGNMNIVDLICDYIEAKHFIHFKDTKTISGETALMWSARLNKINIAKRLLSGGSFMDAEVNLVNLEGESALYIAAKLGYGSFVNMLLTNAAFRVVFVNLKTRLYGQTALMVAAKGGFADIVGYLVNAGADMNIHGAHGKTALDLSITYGHDGITKYLISRGAKFRKRGAKVTSKR